MEIENEKRVENAQTGCGGGDCDNCDRKDAGGCCCGDSLRGKLHSYNYWEDIPGGYADDDMVEVVFKNTRKGFYRNSAHLPLEIGDMVAVEASPGHDIGRVSLTGALVRLQMRKANIKPDAEVRRVFRKARPSDLERYEQARARENDTMIKARKIAADLDLNMKIGDVEYQGDGNKAIFYYIADERVDFRQLIKVLAERFRVRIEMKQIGARQEAGRIGGFGPCGRPLCCSSWMTNFVSVSTGAARYQDISLNPQKLAGQCAKLKCCLNYEIDAYVEASKKLPPRDAHLETADATFYYFKADILRHEVTYSTDRNIPANLVTITARRAFEIIELNKAGEKPLSLAEDGDREKKPSEYADILGQDSLTRFDNKKKKKKKGPKGGGQNPDNNGSRKENPEGGKPRQEKPEAGRSRQEKPEAGRSRQEKPEAGKPRPEKGKNPPQRRNNGGHLPKGSGQPRDGRPPRPKAPEQ